MGRFLAVATTLLTLGLFLTIVQGGEEKGITITNMDDKGKEKADGGKVKLPRGEILTVKLAGNPTTGFQWQIEKNDKEALPPQGKHTYQPDKKGKAVGAGGTFIFRFKGEKAGTTDLELVYKRPFEKDKDAAKTFKVQVEIQ
jgi:inhibitor of cysteine peptidase